MNAINSFMKPCFQGLMFLFFVSSPVYAQNIMIEGNGNNIPSNQINVTSQLKTYFGVYQGTRTFSNIPDSTVFFLIRNNGASNLNISNAQITNISSANFFSITTNPAATVAPGATTSIGISFTRVKYGVAMAEITISSDDPATPEYKFYVHANSEACECPGHFYTPDCSACINPSLVYSDNCESCSNGRTPPLCIF